MKTVLPTDCGNSPRITIVGEFVTAWAQRDVEAVSAWLTEDVAWTIVGREDLTGDRVAQDACLDSSADILDVSAIITHGRLASCDGVLETASGRVAFSHVFRFASTSKTARSRRSAPTSSTPAPDAISATRAPARRASGSTR